MAKWVDELKVYQKALVAADEVSAILNRPSLKREPELRKQLGTSSLSVASLIAEGSEQSTDRHFAEYLYRARGSSREVRTQLRIAAKRQHITDAEREGISNKYEEVAKMLTGLIRHPEADDRKHRG